MHFAMVHAAKWDGELIADFAAQPARLGESQMMRTRRRAATEEAWLLSLKVLSVAMALGRSNRKNALVDGCAPRAVLFLAPAGATWRTPPRVVVVWLCA
jgi:hypothetical protein